MGNCEDTCRKTNCFIEAYIAAPKEWTDDENTAKINIALNFEVL